MQIQPVREGMPFQLLQIRKIIPLELHLQNIDTIEAPLGSQINALFNAAVKGISELPEGVSRQADAERTERMAGRGIGGECYERCRSSTDGGSEK